MSSVLPFAPPAVLTRAQAIARVVRRARRHGGLDPQVLQLIALFHLQPEDLLEAGLSYEHARQLEPLVWIERCG